MADVEAHDAAIAEAEAQLRGAQQRLQEGADAADLDKAAVAAIAARAERCAYYLKVSST